MCFILCVCVRETNSNQMNEGCVWLKNSDEINTGSVLQREKIHDNNRLFMVS